MFEACLLVVGEPGLPQIGACIPDQGGDQRAFALERCLGLIGPGFHSFPQRIWREAAVIAGMEDLAAFVEGSGASGDTGPADR